LLETTRAIIGVRFALWVRW